MKSSIPVYNSDGSLFENVSPDGLMRLQRAGLIARVVRHRKGHVNRAILFERPNAARPLPRSAYAGKKSSFETTSERGRSWELRRLGGVRGDKTFAPGDIAPLFAGVLVDRLTNPKDK